LHIFAADFARKTMATPRAIWKGCIDFGSINVPIKLYSAAVDKGIHFRLLDRKTKKPVRQHMVNPDSGDVVEHAETKRGLEVGRGRLVLLDEEEVEKATPPESRNVDILHFYTYEAITHQWYDRPYWVGPDGDNKSYFALASALKKEERQGLAHWVMRKKEYFGALRAEGDHLMLITLRNAERVVEPSSLSAPSGRDLSAKEIAMAKQLIAAMEGELDMTQYKDQYRERVLDFVKAKAAGKIVKFPKVKEKSASRELTSALERSLAAAKEERASA
jgi:DNA end-binding protein Ku